MHTLQNISDPDPELQTLGSLSMTADVYATVSQNVQANPSIYGTYTYKYDFEKECLVYIRTYCTGDGSQYSTMTTDSSNATRLVTNGSGYKDWLIVGKVGTSVTTTVYSARYGYYYLHTIGC